MIKQLQQKISPEPEDSDGDYEFFGINEQLISPSPDGKRFSHLMIKSTSFNPHPMYRKSRVEYKGFNEVDDNQTKSLFTVKTDMVKIVVID